MVLLFILFVYHTKRAKFVYELQQAFIGVGILALRQRIWAYFKEHCEWIVEARVSSLVFILVELSCGGRKTCSQFGPLILKIKKKFKKKKFHVIRDCKQRSSEVLKSIP